jgi:hypothetical protein
MSLRSESKKQLYEDKVDKGEMKETDTIRRPLPRFQKDSTNSVSAGRERASANPRGALSTWPLLPFFATVLCMCVIGLHLLPTSKYMNFADPFTSFDPSQKVGRRSQTALGTMRMSTLSCQFSVEAP